MAFKKRIQWRNELQTTLFFDALVDNIPEPSKKQNMRRRVRVKGMKNLANANWIFWNRRDELGVGV